MIDPLTTEGEALGAREPAVSLLSYCQARNWAGWDPYDALNSRIFKSLPFLDSKWPRLALTQALKRAPINLRPLLLISPSQNPKGLALFLQALLKLQRLGLANTDGLCESIVQRIAELRAPNMEEWAWGYSFPWQTRTRLVPLGASNLVCTTFVAEALLDYYDARGDEKVLSMAVSAARHIVDDLYWEKSGIHSFSYPYADSRVAVHNANLLAASLLFRLQEHSEGFEEVALKVSRYAVEKQQSDGSWVYGDGSTQGWIDNFHTGFNLCALHRIRKFSGSDEFNECLTRGYDFYRANFFERDGAPKYFHNRTQPLDVHSAAQSLITLTELREHHGESMPLARKVRDWTLRNLRDEAGYFCYQKRSWGRIKIPYMRWGQAWMLLALATVLEVEEQGSVQVLNGTRSVAREMTEALR